MAAPEVVVSIIGQRTCRPEVDYLVNVDDLIVRHRQAEAVLAELGKRQPVEGNSGSEPEMSMNVGSSFRVEGCLVDSRLLATALDGYKHVLGIAGEPDRVQEVQNLLNMRLPRHFSGMPDEYNTGKYDHQETSTSLTAPDLERFTSVQAVLEVIEAERRQARQSARTSN